MQSAFSNAVSEMLTKHAPLSRTRRETLAWLVLLMMRFGAASLWRLAAHVETAAKIDSVRRRFYRFFQHVRLDAGVAARIVARLLDLEGRPWVLAIDRTNWKLGKTEINILMICVEWRGIGVPLIFTVLSKAGNSSTAERIDLLDRLKRVFPDMKIAALTGDREFIGNAWMAHLEKEKIPFVLRPRENQHVVREGFETWPVEGLAQNLKRGQSMTLKGFCRLGLGGQSSALRVRIVIMRLKTGELLALENRDAVRQSQNPRLRSRSNPHHRSRKTRNPHRHYDHRRDARRQNRRLRPSYLSDPG